MSLESGNVLPPPQYSSHDFSSSFTVSCTNADSLAASVFAESVHSSPLSNNITNKTPNPSSTASLNHASTPSPSYPSSNSWPGFGGKNSRIEDVQGITVEPGKSPSSVPENNQKQPSKVSSYFVFTSTMANEAIFDVQQRKYDSIVAWHKAHCQPSTSKTCLQSGNEERSGRSVRVKGKRKNMFEDVSQSPSTSNCTSSFSSCNANVTSSVTNVENRVFSSNSNMNRATPTSTAADLLILGDEIELNGDNPLRRMERMTQDSLFEPPTKTSRTVSNEGSQLMKRDQDRNAKLEKMRTIEQQIFSDKARSEWERMVQEHEMFKIYQNQPMIQGFPPNGSTMVAAPYPMPPPPVQSMHPAYRRNAFQQPVNSMQHSSSAPSTGVYVNTISGDSPLPLERGQPRASLNPPPYSMHVPSECYMQSVYPPGSYPPQGYMPNMSSSISPAYSPIYPQADVNGLATRSYSMCQSGMRSAYATEKTMPTDMWMQQLPQPQMNLDTRMPCQKLQYPPGRLQMEDGCGDGMTVSNQMY
ncbi:hypothetical protein AB6A40_002613 [Gnathostoma spinigerum]|uniref:Uncharacterized protein n=1 Tax=Gnathostoma spinigerum TaxID=75299 RepID=A0ABD6EEX3_9BILA